MSSAPTAAMPLLSVGDPIYPGDILESDPGGAASISVGDQMVVSLGGGGRMILNSGPSIRRLQANRSCWPPARESTRLLAARPRGR